MNSDNNKNCWYAAGLHFECFKCGRCCSGPSEGYIWVTGPEIKLIAEFLDRSVNEIKKQFLKRVGLRTTIIEDAGTRDCVFLKYQKTGKSCSIYPVRPAQCRTWPFWSSNLARPNDWNMAARKCPGINRGKYHSPEQIRAIKNSPPWWENAGK